MRVLFVLFLSAFAPFLAAQTYTAAHIAFSDLGPFTQQQLEDASGLHTGSTLTAQDLSAAAQRLVNTGYFDGIDATLDGKISSATVQFDDKPTPLQHMLHVTFTDLVWLTPAEIDAAIKQKFPLFIGYLPENSPHQDDIKAALTSALAAKSISARVAATSSSPPFGIPRGRSPAP